MLLYKNDEILLNYFIFAGKEEKEDTLELGDTLEETEHSIIKIVPHYIYTLDFSNLFKAISLKPSGELA